MFPKSPISTARRKMNVGFLPHDGHFFKKKYKKDVKRERETYRRKEKMRPGSRTNKQ